MPPVVPRFVRAAFHEPGTAIYRWVQGTVWGLILLSIVLLVVEFIVTGAGERNLAPGWTRTLEVVDVVVLVLFGIEITARLASWRPPELDFFEMGPARALRTHVLSRLRYAVEPLNLIDIITVLAVLPQLRALRALRLLRLVRLQGLFRYNNPLTGVLRAFDENRLLYLAAFSLLGLLVLLGGTSVYLAEGVAQAGNPANPGITSLRDGLWWALVTITTVGYGDISPVTGLGRIIGGTLMVSGMFMLALFAGIVGSTMLSVVMGIREEQYRMAGFLDHVVICGYEEGSRLLLDNLAQELDPSKTDVLLFATGDRPSNVPHEFKWIHGDPTKEGELAKVHLHKARSVVIVGGRSIPPAQADATTILTVFTVRRWLGRHPDKTKRRRPLHVVAEILDHENVDHARTAGADEVIETTNLGFSLLSHAVVQQGTADLMSRVVGHGFSSLYVGRIPDGIDAPIGFADLTRRLRREQGVLLIGFKDSSGTDRINAAADVQVGRGDKLLYLAESETLPRV